MLRQQAPCLHFYFFPRQFFQPECSGRILSLGNQVYSHQGRCAPAGLCTEPRVHEADIPKNTCLRKKAREAGMDARCLVTIPASHMNACTGALALLLTPVSCECPPVQVLGFLPTHGRPGLSSGFLVVACLSRGCEGHCGRETIDGDLSLFVCLSKQTKYK